MDDVFSNHRRRRPATADGTKTTFSFDQDRGRSQHRGYADPPSYAEPSTASGSSKPSSAASRIMSSMKRSLSYSATKKRESSVPNGGMISTREESLPPSPTAYSFHDARNTRPSIEQIAMGLHISRTPHLSPYQAQNTRPRRHATLDYGQHPRNSHLGVPATRRPSLQQQRRGSAPALVLPPPPARSSLKKPTGPPAMVRSATGPRTPSASASDASLSSLTSAAPSTPRSAMTQSSSHSGGGGGGMHFSHRLQLSMFKLLPGRKGSTPPSTRSPSVRSADDDSASSMLTPRKVVRFSADEDP